MDGADKHTESETELLASVLCTAMLIATKNISIREKRHSFRCAVSFLREGLFVSTSLYRVILKKVSFRFFSIILVFEEEKNFTMKSKDKLLSLSKFS